MSVLDQLPPRALGAEGAPLHFGLEGERGRRLLWLDGKPAYELSLWCGTCPFLFERLEGANRSLSLPELSERLAGGLERVDEAVLAAVSPLLPPGEYLPLLEELAPRLVMPAGPGDYFAGEQVATWGIDRFWGLPEYPRTPYYRAVSAHVEPGARLFEFVVPMVPPTWNDPAVVAGHAERLAAGSAATCLAVATLDICQPADWDDATQDGLVHWGLTHFVLDGHHKLQAAAEGGRRLRLLSLLALEQSLANRDELLRLPGILAGSESGSESGSE